MKTQFATIIATVALLVTTNIIYAKASNAPVEVAKVGSISKIEASGNVEVYLVNGDHDAVKVYDDYYGQNAVVQNKEGVLHIASYATDKLVVFVTVADLKAITANDNARVRSYGDALSAKGLDITLNDDAVVQLKVDAIGAKVTVNDEARAEFAGAIENYELDRSATAKVNADKLETRVSRKNVIEAPKTFRTHAMAFGMYPGL